MTSTKQSLIILFLLAGLLFYYLPPSLRHKKISYAVSPHLIKKPTEELNRAKTEASRLKTFIRKNNFNSSLCFLIDMQLSSGKKRFTVYDLAADTVLFSGLVAHGSCMEEFLETARFSNEPHCGCSSIGRYKISYAYKGRFGKSYKLIGLDATNSNAFQRNIVLHSYDRVPDKEIYAHPICNSLGCPMVSPKFFNSISSIIDASKKPILLYVYS